MGFVLLWQGVQHTNSLWYWKKSQSAEKHPLKERAATKLPASHKFFDHPTLVSSAADAEAKKVPVFVIV